ncbi:MAG: hypothetical protein J07AB43_01760, partial [Candidatus Nanosalina sp. J07AB43]
MGLDEFKTSEQTNSPSNTGNRWSGEEKLKIIRHIHEKHGDVNRDLIGSSKKAPSVKTYTYNYGSIAEAQIEAGISPSEIDGIVECESCNTHYTNIAKHWAQSPCSQNDISDKQKQILIGHLMGDATLLNRSSKSPRMKWVMANRDYMLWLDQKLGWVSNGVSLKQSSCEVNSKLDNGDFSTGE